MSDCIFCRIVAGTAAAELVHETPDAIAFLDRTPTARGHVLVVPRVHAASLPELDDARAAGLFRTVKEVMRKVDAALRPAGMNVGWNQGEAAGQTVFHLHVHVLPRHADGGHGVQALGDRTGDRRALGEVAEAIRRAKA